MSTPNGMWNEGVSVGSISISMERGNMREHFEFGSIISHGIFIGFLAVSQTVRPSKKREEQGNYRHFGMSSLKWIRVDAQ